MFWTEDGRGKKEKGKEKSVVTWVDEKKKKEVEPCVWREKKKREKRKHITIFSQYFHNKI